MSASPGARTGVEASPRRLLSYLRPYKWAYAAALLCTVLSAVFDAFSLLLLIPFLRSVFDLGPVLPEGGRNAAERAIELVAGEWIGSARGWDALLEVCLVVLAALVLKNLFHYGSRLLAVHVQERVERDLRDGVYGHLQRLPLAFYAREKTGQLISRVLSDTREAKALASHGLADAVRHAATVLAYLAALLVLSWRLTALALVLLPLVVGTLAPLMRRLRRRFRDVHAEQGELTSALEEAVGGVRLVKAYGAEPYESARFRRRSDGYARELVRTQAVAELASPVSETLAAIVALGLVWAGGRLVLVNGTLGPEQFLVFVTIALRMISPVKRLAQFPALAQRALAAADRLFEVLDVPREPYVETGRAGSALGRPLELRERLRLEDVWFAYEPTHPVLRGVDLEIRPGEVVALVGASGAGKSTLADLLPRFIEPDRGRVTLDGVDTRELPLEAVRALFGLVSQETVLFHDTARANIAYGAPDRWTRDQIETAARAAHAHEFLVRLPDGYDTILGDRGVRISGGQRQRLAVARALLRDPPILILDEATSSLDPESELLVRAAIRRLFRNRTALVIAHRLSTVRGADRIVVLHDGRVVEVGTHEELYGRDGRYRRLCELQLTTERVGASR